MIVIIVKEHLVPYSAGMVPAFGKDGRIGAGVHGYIYPGRYSPIARPKVKNGRIAKVHIIVTIKVQCCIIGNCEFAFITVI